MGVYFTNSLLRSRSIREGGLFKRAFFLRGDGFREESILCLDSDNHNKIVQFGFVTYAFLFHNNEGKVTLATSNGK